MSKPHLQRLLVFLLPSLGMLAGPALADDIFSSGFDNTVIPAGAISFKNETTLRLDQILDSVYRFDAMWADFNGDGCYDAWIFSHDDQTTSRLWLNRCDGSNTFVYESSEAVGYYIPNPTNLRGSGWVTLVDFNGDGRQDFWTSDISDLAARYVNATASSAHVPFFSTKQPACRGCVLADVNGDDRLEIVFNDLSSEDAVDYTPLASAKSGASGHTFPGDVDGDSWIDLLQPDNGGYWHNNHGQFSWVASPALAGNLDMTVFADFDNDGDNDLFTFSGDNNAGTGAPHLYRNDNGVFTDVTAGSGLDKIKFVSWWTSYGNAVAADLDNDGLQDLVVSSAQYAPAVDVLHNLGNMHFQLTSVDLGVPASGSESAKSRVAVADFDNDGRLDILTTQDVTNAGIWHNTTQTGTNYWMKVRVRGEGLNSDGLGADLKWYRHGSSALVAHMTVQANSQHAQTWLHTGVGNNPNVDLVITWPHGGPVQRYDNLAADQEVIAFPNGCLVQHWTPGHGWPLSPPANCATDAACVRQAPQTVPRNRPPVRPASVDERVREAATASGKPIVPPSQGSQDCND
jgi:hypothetical protein